MPIGGLKEPSTLVEYYAQRAREYERIYHKPERQVELARLHQIIGKSFAGERVLELACGTGYWTQTLATSAAAVLATDINEEVLEVARSKRLPGDKVTFAKADAYNLPVTPENSGCFGGRTFCSRTFQAF